MIYKSSQGDLDLSKLTRLYPAGVVDMQGEIAEMSLEWIDLYGEKVKILHYVLVFDFTPPSQVEKQRTLFRFETKEQLIEHMREVAQLFQ
jgi:hypothetical protein